MSSGTPGFLGKDLLLANVPDYNVVSYEEVSKNNIGNMLRHAIIPVTYFVSYTSLYNPTGSSSEHPVRSL